MIATAPVMPVPARTLLRRGPNGTLLYGSRQALPDGAARVTDWLAGWARATPDAIFLAERRSATDRRWREMTYAEAWQGACAVATGLLAAGHGAARPAMVLAPNGLDHAVLALGTMLAGIPYAPVTPMLAAEGADPARLRHVLALLRPSLIFVADAAAAPGLRGQSLEGAELVVGAEGLAALRGDAAPPPPAAPDAVSKILLTSGSTGAPKAVICTHRGMATNMRMTIAAWPFLGRQRPVLTCWLPWNHAFGGNHHFHTVLALGGTLRIDDSLGRPALFDRLIENLAEVPPTFFGAVPAGFAALLPVLERDAAFRARFFGRLDALFSAGAAMPQETWDRLHAAGAAARGAPVPVLAGWGATECGPGATLVQGRAASPADIGTPLPGVEIKLAPVADKLELRVRSPSVTPGYWGDPARTEAAFDAQGYFRTGDAGRFADPGDPDAGLVFDGRIAEDFKLASGTWVSVGPLRLALLRAAAPLLTDLVITGENEAAPGALVWADPAALGLPADDHAGAAASPRLRRSLAAALARHNAAQPGGSTRIARCLVLAEPPSRGAGEVNEKGYVNQRAALGRRAAAVRRLHAAQPDPGVILPAAVPEHAA